MLVRIENAKDIASGEMRVFDVAGTKVNIASVDGHLHAFDDTFTHRACSLAKGKLDGRTVTCPATAVSSTSRPARFSGGPAQRAVRSRLVQMEDEGLLVES